MAGLESKAILEKYVSLFALKSYYTLIFLVFVIPYGVLRIISHDSY